MNKTEEIFKLWKYYGIADDERLIILSYSPDKGHDEYYVAEMNNNQLSVKVEDKIPELDGSYPFQIIQHIGESGKHEIPSVESIIENKNLDY